MKKNHVIIVWIVDGHDTLPNTNRLYPARRSAIKSLTKLNRNWSVDTYCLDELAPYVPHTTVIRRRQWQVNGDEDGNIVVAKFNTSTLLRTILPNGVSTTELVWMLIAGVHNPIPCDGMRSLPTASHTNRTFRPPNNAEPILLPMHLNLSPQ